MAGFDIERFVTLSNRVDTSDLDWDEVARVGVTDDEHLCLRYMADVESHTILYMKDLLVGHTAYDPEVTSFLSCWVYEEFHHGRAIDQFLTAAGRVVEPDRFDKVRQRSPFQETLEAVAVGIAASLTPHFMATHMTWGAINEACAAAAYMAIARRTENRQLSILLTRLAKDERRHFSFYYHQAEKRLSASPVGRFLCWQALSRFWSMVGVGIGTPETMDYLFAAYFNSRRGYEELATVDRSIRRLPGQEGWDRVIRERDLAIQRYRAAYPQKMAELEASEAAWEQRHLLDSLATAPAQRTAEQEQVAVA